jgi:hypothetical protein
LVVCSHTAGWSSLWDTDTFSAWRQLAAIALTSAAIMQGAAAAERHAADPTRGVAFDLPAQPLGSALEAYSVASGWQVVYNGSLAEGRRSSGVTGVFPPDAALRMLLRGTGLIPEYKSADSVLLAPDPMATLAPEEIADDVNPSLKSYFGTIQTHLARAFCASDPIREGAYRIALSFWIGPSGNVTQLALLSSTGRADIDERFSEAVGSLAIGAASPAGFSQPVVLLVTPDLVGRCDRVNTGAHPISAAR